MMIMIFIEFLSALDLKNTHLGAYKKRKVIYVSELLKARVVRECNNILIC